MDLDFLGWTLQAVDMIKQSKGAWRAEQSQRIAQLNCWASHGWTLWRRRRPSGRSSSGAVSPHVYVQGGVWRCSRSGWFSAQCGQTRAQNRPGSGMRDGSTRLHLLALRSCRDRTSGGLTSVVKRTEVEARKGHKKVKILACREILRITDFCTFPDRITS